MLIIKGASYSPPSGGSQGSQNPPNLPAQEYVYRVFYKIEGEDKWYSDRSRIDTVAAVGLVIMDAFEIDLESITYTKPETLDRVFFFPSTKPGSERGWTSTEIDSPMQHADAWQLDFEANPTQPTPSWLRSLFVWIDDSGAQMSSSRVDEVVAAARTSIIFNHG